MGVARQRKAIVEGLKDTVSDFTTNVAGSGAQSVMDILLMTQYFDVLKGRFYLSYCDNLGHKIWFIITASSYHM